MNQNNFKISVEQAGVISEKECWVCRCEGYLYTADSLDKLIKILNKEWKNDKHIVG